MGCGARAAPPAAGGAATPLPPLAHASRLRATNRSRSRALARPLRLSLPLPSPATRAAPEAPALALEQAEANPNPNPNPNPKQAEELSTTEAIITPPGHAARIIFGLFNTLALAAAAVVLGFATWLLEWQLSALLPELLVTGALVLG